ncbi:LTA synthase family protein [Tenuifilum thalassicum]|uniref:Sulfatase-like hydrolase/transferase n=1 Tax=Tenuifilum thalassicum TaxID=2590900 RepID=A0A7D3XV62_9BACT|nr:alkaline phosphatase family protein [Tenuifilum thalassicum]QKG79648.1 sulfatase-like hydrolase/transferase [Tenuifilum thalassicum]
MINEFKNYFSDIKLRGNIYLMLIWRFTLVMLIFSVCRVLFYLFNTDFFANVTLSSFLRMMAGGLWFDSSALIYTNLLYLFIYLLPFTFRYNRWVEKTLKYLYVITNSIAIGANLADIIYFRFTLRRTTSTLFSEFKHESNFGSLIPKFIADYWYIFLIWVALTAVLVIFYGKVKPIKKGKGSQYHFVYGLNGLVLMLLFATLMVGGMRGGFRHSTRPITLSNAGQYVSEPLEAAIVLNTPFAIYRTLGKKSLHKVDFYSSKEELNSIYTPVHHPQTADSLKRMNVVIFILESFGREYIGAYNTHLRDSLGYKGFTPFLDSLINHSLWYRYAFGNGRKSIDGMPSVLASIPMFVEPYFLTSYSTNKINSIASLLRSEGYHTAYFHGAPNGSMGFQAFANVAGFEEYYGMTEYNNPDDFDGMWGIWDEEFFQFFAKTINGFKQPFCAALFSVSSHHPFKIPERYQGKFPKGTLPIHQCIAYTDYSLKRFFQTASKMDWFKNTLFVITADHPNQSQFKEYQSSAGAFSVPLLFYTPNGSLVGRKDELAQQIDIMPSVLGYLNYNKPFVAFGRNLFDKESKPFVVNYTNNSYQLLMDDYVMVFDGNQTKGLYSYKSDILMKENLKDKLPDVVEKMEHFLKAVIQQYNSRMIEDKLTQVD